MLEKADSNNDGKISFDDFYSVMVKTSYWFNFIILFAFKYFLKPNLLS